MERETVNENQIGNEEIEEIDVTEILDRLAACEQKIESQGLSITTLNQRVSSCEESIDTLAETVAKLAGGE